MSEKTIGRGWAARQGEEFGSSRANRIARNAVTAADVMQAARDTSVMRGYHDTYGVRVPKTAEITNQRQSGRCWMFTAYNVARHATMDFLDVDSFEFSQAFGMFYDKLEKANAMLEHVIATSGLPADSREVQFVLQEGMSDGGYYHFAMNLIAKWGVVPKDAMPETACSKSSSQMDAQLERLLRRDAGILRRAYDEGRGENELRALKDDMLSDVYRMLSICLGEPPARFDFVCTVGKKCKADASKVKAVEPQKEDDSGEDKGEKGEPKDQKLVLRDPGITPLEFAERYLPFDPHDYVSLVSMPGKTRPYGHAYHLTLTDSVVGGDPHHVLNVEPELLDQVAVNSLRAGVPVSMACDVMQEFPRNVEDFKYVLSTDGMDLEGLFDVKLGMDRGEMIDMCETGLTHAMTFQGVELGDDGKPRAWRIENSWGKEQGKDGYLIMTADWFHTYGGEVDVRREFVPTELLKMWDETPVEDVAPWSGVTSGFARKLR